ncbi:MAG: succinate dehydrogenase, hydrophobic membrane anchor protein [Rhodospirillales bacterium]|jgi:succinate dehydrogenase / fumarate reductase membrane anchor subunit|nr:succinate dehydrogenase, hydrophobic membrane anchor protein [Rhodospirillales bacterium]MDP6804254.1 succinate dehydrogenase, hydrophobic membrane anchor protein [Rhodospirillales bacterium]
MRSPLGRVRGVGSTGEATAHFWAQRMTSLALIPLSLWFVFAALTLVGADHATFKAWLGHHGNVLLMVLFVAVLFHHAQLGLQMVIEDYVHAEGAKLASLIAVKFAAVLCGASCALAALNLAYGG